MIIAHSCACFFTGRYTVNNTEDHMFNIQFPSTTELLSNYQARVAEDLINLQRKDPGNVEKHDPVRLELQAVMYHLRKASK